MNKIHCDNCGGDLEITKRFGDQKGGIIVVVIPCKECARRQYDSGYVVGRAHKKKWEERNV